MTTISTVHLSEKTAQKRKAVADSSTVFDHGIWSKQVKVMSNGVPELTPDRTGKVFIEKDNGELELLEGACYSNISMEVYDTNGNKHPDMSQYHGRKWSLKFKINDKDRFGKKHEFESAFLSPLPYGVMGPVDWQGIPECEQQEASTGIKYGAFSGYDDPYLKKYITVCPSAFCVYTAPYKQLKEIEPLVKFLSFTLLIDDQVDSNKYFDKTMTYEELQAVRDKMMEVVEGKRAPDEQEVSFEFPQLKPICRYLFYLREAAVKLSDTPEIVERWVKDMADYLNGLVIANDKEWIHYKKICKTGTELRAHRDLRNQDSGILPVWTMQLITYLNKLQPHIYHGHLFQHFRNRCMDHVVTINDLFSYKKEIRDGETCNTVYIRHHREGMDFIETLKSLMKDINDCAVDMWEISRFLLMIHKNDEELAKAIEIHQSSCLGHINFYNYNLRYHNGVVFDVVIHKDKWDWNFEMNEKEPRDS